jgi:malonyl-CoA decarboxylase
MLQRFLKSKILESVQQTCRRLLSERGESNAQSMARRILDGYEQLNPAQRIEFFQFLSTQFNPDPARVQEVASAYASQPNGLNLMQLFRVVEPPRQELLRRINRAPNATGALVRMRAELLKLAPANPDFRALDADLHHLFTSWFNPGFLELHEITWNSPAQLLEKIIQHEAVHAIDGWDDLRRRLQPDRRCFGFFHPQLPGEPLIFVEVALVSDIADDVAPLLDKKGPLTEDKKQKTAIFYSISNCQPGLRGVSLGNFLIKRVADRLLQEVPGLKTFSTLSPIPGFTAWLDQGAPLDPEQVSPSRLKKATDALATLRLDRAKWAERLRSGWHPADAIDAEREALMRLCALYLMYHTTHRGGDSVGKFHLSNGATLYRINWGADLSKKGIQQSGGIMVHYLYELDKVETQHEAFMKRVVVYARGVEKWA